MTIGFTGKGVIKYVSLNELQPEIYAFKDFLSKIRFYPIYEVGFVLTQNKHFELYSSEKKMPPILEIVTVYPKITESCL